MPGHACHLTGIADWCVGTEGEEAPAGAITLWADYELISAVANLFEDTGALAHDVAPENRSEEDGST